MTVYLLPGGESNYSRKELRKAVKLFHELPKTHPIYLDLSTAYDRLGAEHQAIFDMYAEGYPLLDIAKYWHYLHHKPNEIKRHVGDRLVRNLIDQLWWLVGTRMGSFDKGVLERTGITSNK